MEELNGNVELRTATNKDGFLMSDEGNILLDVYFNDVQDIGMLNQTLLMMPGIVDTSLFVDILTGIILVNDKGVFKKKKIVNSVHYNWGIVGTGWIAQDMANAFI